MEQFTRRLWDEQDGYPGDRFGLFSVIAEAFDVSTVLYPGSFVDLAPSFVSDTVCYVDANARAARFFADVGGVNEIIAEHRQHESTADWRFIHADYSGDIGLLDCTYDLLVSLYAGFVSEHCTRYVRPGGLLLVNPSHGDAAMASVDPNYRLVAAVTSHSGGYAVRRDELDSYLIPKRPVEVTAELLHETGRGIAYTKSPFAYVFQRVGD